MNAGPAMVMVPFEHERFIRAVDAGVAGGVIPKSRVDDACRRILEVKAALGLFDDPFGDRALMPLIGSDGHRAVAREAVNKSQLLLKNSDAARPIAPDVRRLLCARPAAAAVGHRAGGESLRWQGGRGA